MTAVQGIQDISAAPTRTRVPPESFIGSLSEKQMSSGQPHTKDCKGALFASSQSSQTTIMQATKNTEASPHEQIRVPRVGLDWS
jgi:hypothetical protein